MGEILKRTRGVLLISAAFLPAMVFAGSIAGSIAADRLSVNLQNQTYYELSQQEEVRQIIEEQSENNAKLLEENQISLKQYDENMAYLKSEEFLDGVLASNEKLAEEFQDEFDHAKKLGEGAIWAILPFCVSVLFGAGLYNPSHGFTIAGEMIRGGSSMIKDANEKSRNKRQEKKLKKEIEGYTERVID